jgi:itaconyl-CoA hydratase
MSHDVASTARLGGSPLFGDLSLGDVIDGPGMTVTDAHLVTWAGLTGDIVSLHLDEEYAAKTRFGARIAHGPLVMSLGLGLMTQTRLFVNVVAWLGVDAVVARAPVFIGDTVHPRATLLEARETTSGDKGIWTVGYEMLNQRGEIVMSFTSRFMIPIG